MKKFFFFLLWGGFLASQLLGATIFLKNGQVLPGKILKMDKENVILVSSGKVGFGKIFLRRREISRISALSTPHATPSKKVSTAFSSPEINFEKLNRIFLQSYQSLKKKEALALKNKKYSFSSLGLSLVLPAKWNVQKSKELVKMRSSAGKIAFFSAPAPSLNLSTLVHFALRKHFKFNPSFRCKFKKIDPCRGVARIEGLGGGKTLIQRFYLWRGRVFVITAFCSDSKGEREIREILGSSKPEKLSKK